MVSADMMADCLTKDSAKPDRLHETVDTGQIPNVDKHPPFREIMKGRHKAFHTVAQWIVWNLQDPGSVTHFLGVSCYSEIKALLSDKNWYTTEVDDWYSNIGYPS